MEINPIFLGEQPENVWRLFSTICTIPHRSHLHGPMCRFLLDYARGHGLTAYVDAAHNVVVHKEASLGRENAPPLVLQAHYDMVCMAEEGVRFDFDKQALNLRRNGDKVYAEGTTLGGDDGIDVAIILDILGDSHAVHPSLEAVFTADEEDGMDGAFGLDCERLRGRLWINLDASPVKVSCFGSLSMSLRLRKTTEEIAKGSLILRLGIDGLQGGHSGNLATSERGNAIVLLNRALCKLRCQVPFQLVSIDGGVYGGAFPRTAEAVVAMDPDEHAKALEVIGQLQRDFQVEFAVRDPHVHVFLTPFDGKPVTAFSKDTLDRLLKLLLILPDGVFTHDHEYPDTAETSSNLGRIETFEKEILVLESIRSLIGAKKQYLREKVEALCGLLDVDCEIIGEIPQWRGSINEKMRDLLRQIYPERPPVACKGTMECGIFASRMPADTEILVLGSPFYLPHSPAEYILIDETALFAGRLREFIANVDWEHLGKYARQVVNPG